MTSYTWTAEQRRQLGPGCTVVRGDIKERVTVVDVVRDADGHDIALTDHLRRDGYLAEGGCSLSRLDPSTLEPPTPMWLHKMACRKLGGRLRIASDEFTKIYHDEYVEIFRFCTHEGVHHRTLCDRFLDALPEVE